MAIRIFTVMSGEITPGALVRKRVTESGEDDFAIVIGRDKDQPGFLPVKGQLPPEEKEGKGVEIQIVELDTERGELVACSDDARVDDEQVLVVFSAAKGDAYYQGGTCTESHSGINGQMKPLNSEAYRPVYPEVQFIRCLTKDEVVTAHGRYNGTLHTEFFCWDGERFHPMERNRNTLAYL